MTKEEHIVDGGSRTKFATGAVREIDETKGRCDLVYNIYIAELINDYFYENMEHFIRTGDREYLIECGKHIIKTFYNNWCDAYLDLSRHYAAGAKKYSDRNMEKGLPFHSMVDSALRHYTKCCRGDDDENHKAACLWNLTTLVYMIDFHPELNDLPYKKDEK